MPPRRKPVEPTLIDVAPTTPHTEEKPTARALTRRQAVVEAPKPEPDSELAVLERIAKDPTVDVGKLERIIELQKDIRRVRAKIAFDTAFSLMQSDLPTVTKRGAIKKKDGTVQSRYAKLEDIHTAIKPVLQKHGFSIRHRTEWPEKGTIRVVGVLAHESGHSETSSFEAPMDRSDYRSDIQSMGSTVSYGRRYTTIDLLNITTAGEDNDGQKITRQRENPETVNPDLDKPLTKAQLQDLGQRATRSGRTVSELSVWVAARYGVQSSAGLTRRVFQEVASAIEAPGPLPMPEEE